MEYPYLVIGASWIAEEALSISLLCALLAQDDFRKGGSAEG